VTDLPPDGPGENLGGVKPRKKLTRRQLVTRASLLAAGVLVGGTLWETNVITVTRHRVALSGLPKGTAPFRMVQLSDLHRSSIVSEGMVRRAAAVAMEEKPDLIALTGDFVTNTADWIGSCCSALEGLRASLGIWGVLGNHDYSTRQPERIVRSVERMGCRMLVNTNARLDNGLWLAGFDEVHGGRPDVEKTYARIPARAPVLTLGHNPRLLELITDRDTTLICGHTHGRQINLPGFSFVTGRNYYFVAGWYKKGRASMYINRGIGVIRIPVRVFSPPEVTVFDFVPA
jgi:uncharacterized protein